MQCTLIAMSILRRIRNRGVCLLKRIRPGFGSYSLVLPGDLLLLVFLLASRTLATVPADKGYVLPRLDEKARRHFNSPDGVRIDSFMQGVEHLPLWPQGAPQAADTDPKDQPVLYVFPAPKEMNSRTAIIVCPGGGYLTLAVDHEGKQVAEWLNTLGVHAFVLRYRVGTWDGKKNKYPVPFWDVRRAVRLVRSRAATWGIAKDRIGVMGFSAGGHLASTISTHFDTGGPGRC